MAKHRTHSIEFKRQVVQDFIAGETLHGLAATISRALREPVQAKHDIAPDNSFVVQTARRLRIRTRQPGVRPDLTFAKRKKPTLMICRCSGGNIDWLGGVRARLRWNEVSQSISLSKVAHHVRTMSAAKP